MEDSATLGSDTSAMTVFGEAVFPHCLFRGISASRKQKQTVRHPVKIWAEKLQGKPAGLADFLDQFLLECFFSHYLPYFLCDSATE